jgi:hypothetical protein
MCCSRPLKDVELEIVTCTVRPTKAGDGKKLVPCFRVLEGEHAGREFILAQPDGAKRVHGHRLRGRGGRPRARE